MGLDSIVILIIVIAIILTTIILVMREFKHVKKDLIYEETLSRENEQVLNTNMKNLQSSLTKRIATESNNINTVLQSSVKDLSTRMTASNDIIASQVTQLKTSVDLLGTSNVHFEQKIGEFYKSDSNMSYLISHHMRIGDSNDSGIISYDSRSGVNTQNSNKGSDSYDLSAVRMSTNQLTFAGVSESYMLGVDTSSLYMETPKSGSVIIRSKDSQTPSLVVNDMITSIGSSWMNINGMVTFSNNVAMGIDGDGQLNMVTGLNPYNLNTSNAFILRDRNMIPMFSVNDNKLSAKSNICIENTCLNPTEWAQLKSMAQAALNPPATTP